MKLFDYSLNHSNQDFTGISVGMIGAGKMAKIHSKVLLKVFKNVKLKAVCSRSIESAKKLSSEFSYEKSYTDIKCMLDENPEINAIILAVSHEQSYVILKELIPYQRYILAEKPASFSYTDNLELVKLAQQFSTEIMVAVNRRFYVNYNDAYFDHLRRGPVKLMHVEVNEPIQNFRSRRHFSNWLYSNWPVANSIHYIDLIRHFMGDLLEIKLIEHLGENDCKAYLKMKNGDAFVNIAYNSAAPSGFRFYGNGISADFSGLTNLYFPAHSYELNNSQFEEEFKPGIIGQMDYFLNAVLNKSKIQVPASNIEDHGQSINLVEQLFGTN
jgi:predicted dehydrogenase